MMPSGKRGNGRSTVNGGVNGKSIYICMCTCMYIKPIHAKCGYIYIYINMHMHFYILYIYIHTYIHIQLYTHTCVCVCDFLLPCLFTREKSNFWPWQKWCLDHLRPISKPRRRLLKTLPRSPQLLPSGILPHESHIVPFNRRKEHPGSHQWGFSINGIPLNGWLISWKLPALSGWELGVALFQETSIWKMSLIDGTSFKNTDWKI